MRTIRSMKEVGEGNVVDKQILVSLHGAWNMWEIHCLILLGLFLQIFLFLTAGMRRRSKSLFLRTPLWLAYLSADVVAIFVLGHLAVRASEPRHRLMSFWAPFVLVHLGGQDTITAFSKQDNELWMRHLLSMFTQVAIAGYVVAKASWPDSRLRCAMVLIFVYGCLKYAERTWCLFYSNPAWLRSSLLVNLSNTLGALRRRKMSLNASPKQYMRGILYMMLEGRRKEHNVLKVAFFVDAPPNRERCILDVDSLPGLLKKFQSRAGRYRAYEYVGAVLVTQYNFLYTKYVLRQYSYRTTKIPYLSKIPYVSKLENFINYVLTFLLYELFQFVSTLIALVLFTVAEKGDHVHTSQADINVSYILLVGAIALEASSATMLYLSKHIPSAAWSSKQWSEELGQYSMIKRHVMQATAAGASSSSIQQWIGRRLGGWGFGLLELTRTPITEPVKEFILDNLLLHGSRKEWHVASSRGLLAVQNWKDIHQDPASKSTAEALEMTITSASDFPTSVLIWHLATDICYYHSEDAACSSNSNSDRAKKDKEVSRQISNYIMYLVFKCGVKLTPNSQHVHDKSHDEIRHILSDTQHQQQKISGSEKEAFMKIFEDTMNDEKQDRSTSIGITLQKKHEEPVAPNNTAGDNHVHKLLQSAQAFDSPMLPRARELAQRLVSINEGEAGRWGLIAAVWSEMLYYAAPRCGGAFHYEHLSAGGEFATHVFVLMRELGPFMPPPGDPA